MSEEDNTSAELITITADIVAAHVGNNSVGTDELPGLIGTVYAALAGLGAPAAPPAAAQEPAVSVRASIKPDYIVCLEDGKKLKTLKRYLRTKYDMSPDEYRRKWGLPSDYPMVAPSYAEKRRTLAHAIGLGRKPATAAEAATAAAQEEQAAPAEAARDAKPRRGRPKAAGTGDKPSGKRLSGPAALAKVRGTSAEA